MKNTQTSNPRYYIRSRCPRLTLAFWTFALLLWLFSQLKGAAAPAQDLYWIIVDRSLSMGPGENNLVGPATEKLREFIADLPPATTVQMVFFDSVMGKPARWTGLTPATKTEIERWIATEFRPSGRIRLFDTVGHVLNTALKERDQFVRIGLLVFSDGEDNQSERYKSWAEIEKLSSELVTEHPAAFLRLYSLGHDLRTTPGAPWKSEAVPNAADLRKINLEPPPEARFKIIPETPEVGQKVVLVALPGPGRFDSVSWTFGDGQSSGDFAPEHVYPADAVFHGSLTVTGPGGTDTRPFTLTVNKRVPLTAAFSWYPKAVRIGGTVELIDESGGNPSAWQWFIDGKQAGTGRQFSWKPEERGLFAVRLEISRGGETSDTTKSLTVLPPALDARFAVSPAHSVSLGTSVSFAASENGADVLHEWRASENKIGDHANLAWTPTLTGLVEVVHEVVRGDERAEARDRIEIVAQPPPAKFTVAPGLEVDLGQSVTLTAAETNPAWRHSWRLSTEEEFNGASVTIQTRNIGRVEIIHVVESPGGRAEAREVLLVRDAVTAKFAVDPVVGRAPLAVKFTLHSMAGIVSYRWEFGDGETSADARPLHTYRGAAEYRPRLSVRDVAGREHTFPLPEPVVVQLPPPWWIGWVIGVGSVLLLALASTFVIWDRQRLIALDGRLEWRLGSNRQRIELTGHRLDLNSLQIPGWKPSSTYTLVRRKAAGFQLLRDGECDQAVETDICFEAEGVSFRLLP